MSAARVRTRASAIAPANSQARARIGSLFSGYGGLDLATESVLDGRTVWHCDDDPAATRVLAHHWPNTVNHGDITTVDWHQVAAEQPVDVLCAGFPCQDVSAAGRRAGMTPDTRSGLWTHMARAIAVLKPRTVVIENVRGLLSSRAHRDVEPGPETLGDGHPEPVLRALGAVLGDLASLGFHARWHGLQAADVGAPHARYRVFIVATDTDRLGSVRAGESRGRRAGSADDDRHAWGDYAPAIARWTDILGRPAPSPTVPGARGGHVLSAVFTEWLMGLPEGWVTDLPNLTRNEQLRLLGNGVVPAQATAALNLMLSPVSMAA